MIEWYEFSFKDKYSGEVYLELTFYSNVSCLSRGRSKKLIDRMHLPSKEMSLALRYILMTLCPLHRHRH